MKLKNKYSIKKYKKKNQFNLANPQNSWLKSWDHDNPIENKSKKNYETQFQINWILNDEVEKKIIIKKDKKKLKSTRLSPQTHNPAHKIEITS
jgi:Rps23 Pro-64 3,4-dihydroxylase Tpa1-like proline 4-hydroxylase